MCGVPIKKYSLGALSKSLLLWVILVQMKKSKKVTHTAAILNFVQYLVTSTI